MLLPGRQRERRAGSASIVLRARWALSGTDVRYGDTRWYSLSTAMQPQVAPIVLRVR